ncbi:MAG: nucleotide sugar dehydrogenase [Elusimicrobiota bacterium]
MKALKQKILDRKVTVGILGMGYVGLPLAIEFAHEGFSVIGFDVDRERLRELARGVSYIPDIPSSYVAEAVQAKRFSVTHKFDALKRCDVIIICVPTPLRKTREPDTTYVYQSCLEIASRLRRGQLVVLESTTYPGTTREMALPLFEVRGMRAGRDFYLAFSPERVDPSNKTHGIQNTPKVVGGVTRRCTDLAGVLYGQIVDEVVPVSSTDTAEMVKLLENTFRAVNIGLVNEMALMCGRLGVDIWEVVTAAASKPFGFMPFYPGPGLGGHCIPVDPEFLAWKLKSLNFEPRFIALAGAINSRMPDYAVQRITALLNDARKPVRGSRILLLGVAYKPNVNDVRESPALDVMKLLLDLGANVCYHDPYVPSLEFQGSRMRSRPLTRTELVKVDVTAILTAHKDVDYDFLAQHSRIVFDARNATAGIRRANIHKL